MLRFILEHQRRLDAGHSEFVSLFTIDAACPEVEEALRRGGFNGETGAFEIIALLGVEPLSERCLAHLQDEPCPTCASYKAAGL